MNLYATPTAFTADAHITTVEILLSGLRAADARREVVIKQHSTLTWLDTFEAASRVYTSELLQSNYLRTARSFAQREMAAIDDMHVALRRAERARGV